MYIINKYDIYIYVTINILKYRKLCIGLGYTSYNNMTLSISLIN